MSSAHPAILVHGGAGAPARGGPKPDGVNGAAGRGWKILRSGGSAVDAVEAAVADLEDDPAFNAGYGSVLTSEGTVEMDASIMDGIDLSAGAVCALSGVRNPIHVARAVLRDGTHVLLAGEGARRFAAQHGAELCSPEALVTEQQRRRWAERVAADGGGTVGAVAVDARGDVAAATSTGGIFFKLPGRVGDSAVIGAGTYADNRSGAASATGDGEPILRLSLAKTATDLLLSGLAPQRAAEEAIAVLGSRLGGRGGIIVIDPYGRVGFARNTPEMPVAWIQSGK